MAFGRSNGGGRRAAPREQAPVFVTFVTLNRSGSALLADFSTTGARLKGSHLPDAGEEIILRIEQLRTYATVAWSEDGECGVEFDMHLPAHVIESVRLSFRLLGRQSAESQVAFDHWTHGMAR